jgi:hypothetical protein
MPQLPKLSGFVEGTKRTIRLQHMCNGVVGFAVFMVPFDVLVDGLDRGN